MRVAPRTAQPTKIKNISQKWESQINVPSSAANFTPVQDVHDRDKCQVNPGRFERL